MFLEFLQGYSEYLTNHFINFEYIQQKTILKDEPLRQSYYMLLGFYALISNARLSLVIHSY